MDLFFSDAFIGLMCVCASICEKNGAIEMQHNNNEQRWEIW